ncbi:MAG: acyl-CoA-binding protein [Gammaproteobacteria bacterium]
MGTLKDRVAEPVSLPDRLKIGARRMRLASIGLISKVDAERARLYHQAMALGDSYGRDRGLVSQLTRLGTGTVNLVLEESQRLFDELVEAGEQALAGEPVRSTPAAKLHTPRPVAKSAPTLVANPRPAPAKVAPKPATKAVKPAAKPALKEVTRAAAAPAEDLRQRFDAAKARLGTLTSPPDQLTMLTLYSLFKQATEGDVTGRRPGPTKLVERAKFDERHKIKGMTLDEAMERYIATVNRLVPA